MQYFVYLKFVGINLKSFICSSSFNAIRSRIISFTQQPNNVANIEFQDENTNEIASISLSCLKLTCEIDGIVHKNNINRYLKKFYNYQNRSF